MGRNRINRDVKEDAGKEDNVEIIENVIPAPAEPVVPKVAGLFDGSKVEQIFTVDTVVRKVYTFGAMNRDVAVEMVKKDFAKITENAIDVQSPEEKVLPRTVTSIGFRLKE